MHYLGAKGRIAKYIVPIIRSEPHGRIIEPFCGALGMTEHLKPDIATDINSNLIDLFHAVRAGLIIPDLVTTDQHRRVRTCPDCPVKTFIGYGCSWGGKWFAGYARDKEGTNYASQSGRALMRKINNIPGTELRAASYDDIEYKSGDVVYCDPPYQSTESYKVVGSFDTERFYEFVFRTSKDIGVTFFVSEFTGPDNCKVWERERPNNLNDRTITEKLFKITQEVNRCGN